MLSLARSWLYKAYGVGCWGLFFVVGLTGFIVTLPIPDLHLRRHVTRTTARVFLFLAGFRLRVRGQEWLPDGACVVVANHASYLDGIVLHAVLPVRFAFIIKKEMVTVPLAGFLLRRVGSEFVDRVDRHRAAADVKRVLKRAASGEALACFPEGTFAAHPGVHRFHAGAFVAAARSGLDVVRMLALGAKGVLLGRAWAYALAAAGEAGVTRMLAIIEAEMRVAMALTGVTRISDIDQSILAGVQS